VIGQTIEEACASKAVQQEGNKIKLTDLKERGKNHLNDARQKLREEEKKRKARFIVPEAKKDDWDKEFGDDLLW
jgi:singapore isolate B (sub-type 7) whole genome shotgun sequence assembly, scaffold_0